MVIKVFIV